MNEELDDNSMIDTELQVRLMNLVMGEASDFERDQLQLLMEQRAELVAYYQHLEHLHGLLCDVGSGDASLDVEASSTDDAWQLPANKREQLLAVLDGKVHSASGAVSLASHRRFNVRSRRSRMLVMATIATAACVLISLTLNSFLLSKQAMLARRESIVANTTAKIIDSSSSMDSDHVKALALPSSIAAHDSRVTVWDATTGRAAGAKENALPVAQGFGAAETDVYGYRRAVDAREKTGKPDSLGYFGDYGQVADAATSRGGDGESPAAGHSAEPEAVALSNDGTILLGGVERFSDDQTLRRSEAESKSKADGEAGVAMTVTPRIIVPEAEERILLNAKVEDGPVEKYLAEQLRKMENELGKAPTADNQKVSVGQTADGREALEGLKERSDAAGGNEIAARKSTGQQSAAQQSAAQGEQGAKKFLEETPDNLAIGAVTKNDMLGDVQPEFIEDLDLVIVKGAKREVERTLEVIDGLKQPQQLIEKDEAGAGAELPSLAQTNVPEEARREMRTRMDAFKAYMAKKQQQAAQSKNDEKQIAVLKETYDDLMQQGRYAEAELIAKKVGQLVPNVQNESANHFAASDHEWIDSIRRVDSAYLVPSDALPKPSSTSNAAPSAGRGWRYIVPPSPQVASKERSRGAVERKAVEPKPADAIDEQSAASQAFSTFSLHVSDVSFKLAQAALAQGQWPEAAKIRIEEFVNALDYHDPLPAESEKVACRVDQAIHPFLMQRNMLRISMRTAATGRAQNTPLRLTIVLDNSGSMERADRRQAVVQAMQMLTKQLRPADQVTLISFANTPRLLAEKVVGDQGASLVKLIENLPSEGGTNIEAALSLAREKALEQQLAGAQNRIVLLTDGAVNLGNANPENLAKLVTQLRDAGIAFDAAGISAADLNDEVLEALTRQGDGRYYLLDSADAVAESFAAQIAGALRPSAQNVKVQVEFNPQRVGRYKLLGFEKHRLKQEDFRNDKVDAAEMAAAEAGVAVYHYELMPNGSGDVGSVSVRFRDLASGQMIERRWPIPYDSSTPRLEHAEPTMQLAATAALFAAKLSGGPLADSVDLTQLQKLLANIAEQYATQPRVVQLRTMVEQAKAMQK